ncbi:terminase large subunit [Weissella hellenica]|uniref:terminase large subunit n=1 Tax=Weissella hellenica TaxID=46256 RepID=UPI003888C2EB
MDLSKIDLKQFDDVITQYADDPTVAYAVSVLMGKKMAGDLIQRASYRQLKDLQRVDNDPDFPYTYNPKRTQQIIEFSTLLRDPDSREPFVLSPYQMFIVGLLEGWVDPRVEGAKRFDRAIISMSRANGKTTIMSVLALYNFLFGRPVANRQIAVASADTSHAEALYGYMRQQWGALKTGPFKALQKRLCVEDNKVHMLIPSQSTVMRKLSAQSAPSDGVGHFSLAFIDELHLFKDRSFINSITSGQAFMPYSQIIFISTAGVDLLGPMYQDYKRFNKIFTEGNYSSIDNILFLFWQQDSDDEIDDPALWIKSNPLFELESMRKSATTKLISERNELRSTGKINDFITKNMNRFVNAKDDAFLTAQQIENAIIPTEDFDINGRKVFIGMDFSAVNDDFSVAFVFPYMNNGVHKFHLYSHHFIPWEKAGSIANKSKQDGINYEHSEQLGFSTISTDPYGQINQEQVFWWLNEFIELHQLDVQALLYDAWNSLSFIEKLDTVFPEIMTIPVKQTIPKLYEPTKFLRTNIIRGQITTFDDEVLIIGLSNAVTVGNPSGYKIDKNKNTAKIDAVDAVVDALFEGMYYFDNFTNVETPKKKSMFDGMSPEQIDEYYQNITF